MMNYFHMKSWFSFRMLFVIVQVSLSVCCVGFYTFVHYSALLPTLWFHSFLTECRMIGFGVCLMSPLSSCWWGRERMPNKSSLSLNCFTPWGWFTQWIEDVWVNDTVTLLETHNVTRNCQQGNVGQQVKHRHEYMMLISSIRFTSGFFKTLVGLCWMPNDLLSTLKWSIRASLQWSQYVHSVDNKSGQCLLSGSCILVCIVFFLAICPYVSMGIDALCVGYWQLNKSEQIVSDHNHCEAHTSISVMLIWVRVKGSVCIVKNILNGVKVLFGGLLMWTRWWSVVVGFSLFSTSLLILEGCSDMGQTGLWTILWTLNHYRRDVLFLCAIVHIWLHRADITYYAFLCRKHHVYMVDSEPSPHWWNVPKKILWFLWNFGILSWLVSLTSVQSFGKKIARKCLFYVQICVWNTIFKIPWDGRGILGKLQIFAVFKG